MNIEYIIVIYQRLVLRRICLSERSRDKRHVEWKTTWHYHTIRVLATAGALSCASGLKQTKIPCEVHVGTG